MAREQGADLAGTASRAERWLLIEHHGAWGPRAVEENDLPPPAREWLSAQSALPRSRVLLIRPAGRPASRAALCLYAALTREGVRRLGRRTFGTYEELAETDVAALLADGDAARRPLLLVCTNGRRDRCCARIGGPTSSALAAAASEAAEVWASTHLGGHRYAATGLWLPAGVSYGFLTPQEAPAVAAAAVRGTIHLPCYRGRVFHPPPVQAADCFLRRRTGITGIDALRLVDAASEGEEWEVRFTDAAAGAIHRLRVRVGREEAALVSCSPAKRKDVDRFTLLDHQRVE
ncbi:MAG TPA: sucrase ferredoxin [Thermoanaerobaculia bacterium]|nr:sucrase ferredoxin [Thermoanaerobaculia bacterium]